MKRFLGTVLGWALVPLLLLVAKALGSAIWASVLQSGLGLTIIFKPLGLLFIAGFLFRLSLSQLLKRFNRHDPLEFFDTLEHELTHALFGYLTFSPPVSLSATVKSGGEVQLKGSNPLAALAPYFFPLWAILTMLVGLVVKASLLSFWNGVLFFLLGNFLYRLSCEYRWRQTDLHLYGFLFSTVLIINLLALTITTVFSISGLLSWSWVGLTFSETSHSFYHWFKILF